MGPAPTLGKRRLGGPHSPRPPRYAGFTAARTRETRNRHVKMAVLRSPSHQGADRRRPGTCWSLEQMPGSRGAPFLAAVKRGRSRIVGGGDDPGGGDLGVPRSWGVARCQTGVPRREEGRSPLYLGAHRPSSNTNVWLVWPPPRASRWTPPGLRAPSGSGMRAGGGSDPEPREKRVVVTGDFFRHSALKYTFLSPPQRKKRTFQGRGSGACPGAPPTGRAGNCSRVERFWRAGARPHPHPGIRPHRRSEPSEPRETRGGSVPQGPP